MRVFFIIPILLLLFIKGCAETEQEDKVMMPPVEPEYAHQTMELADDNLKIELFASEPLLKDPVAIDIDEKGRVFVAEMPGYPLDTGGSGRIRLLHDTNGDGYPNESTVFADQLTLPTGVMRWRNGIIVTDAPDILYFEDSTGDGKADIRKVILTGFALTNPQYNVNKPMYGIDNWIYLANRGTIGTDRFAGLFGDRGSEIRYVDFPEGPVLPRNAGDRNVRMRPDSVKIEMLAGWTQFGQDFDAWGRHFLISNAHHHVHETIAARYLERNPELSIRQPFHFTPVHGNAAKVYPITHNPEHQLLTDIGVMTSASGITYYLAELLGEKYEDVTLIAESQHNLVHADKVYENGSVAEARPLLEGVEFLASTDSWFRPVNFYVGPDGAIYVIDYYRRFVEHPQWMDDEVAETEDLYAGINRGRIYRIAPKNDPGPAWTDNIELDRAPVLDLVAALDHPNIWWRRTVQRLLVDRQDQESVQYLEELLESGSSAGRVHALWTLDGLGALRTVHVRGALEDEEAGVRENAIRLAEPRIDRDPSLLDVLAEMEYDPSPRVRYQLLLTLGDFETPRIRQIRERMLFEYIEDEWVQVAALSAPSARGENMLKQAIDNLSGHETPGRKAYFRRIGSQIAAGNNINEIRQIIRETTSDFTTETAWWRSSAIEGLADQIQRMEFDASELHGERGSLLNEFFQPEMPEFRSAILRMLDVLGLDIDDGNTQHSLGRAEAIAADREAGEEYRADAIELLGMADPSDYRELLFSLVESGEPTLVQRTALRQLANVPGEEVVEFVFDRWEAMTPQVRDQAVNVLMTDERRVHRLLDAVEENKILVSTVGWGRRVTLMRDWGGEVRDRARDLLREDPDARQEAIAEYRDALELRGDRQRGRQVYEVHCALCHQIGGESGIEFGPDLSTVRHWTPQSLMSKIIDPNRAIADGYEMWIVERYDDTTISGVISEETDQAVILRDAAGNETTILRSSIESISSTNVSAMPEGMEQQISKQEMADLIEYIRRYQPN